MIIDFHSHLVPKAWGDQMPLPPTLTDIEGLLETKEEQGIQCTVVSYTMPTVPGAPVSGRSLPRIQEWNAFCREASAAHADRIVGIGGIDPFGGPEMLDEMRRAVTDGDIKGVLVNSSVDGKFLGDRATRDFWSLADELEVPVFVHAPFVPAVNGDIVDDRVVEFGARAFDVALSILTIVAAGILERHPKVRIVCANGGGGLAMVLGRLEMALRIGAVLPGAGPPQGPSQAAPGPAGLDRIYVDSCSFSAPALRCNLDLFGSERMLFGTDYPPVPVDARVTLGILGELGLPDDARERILWRNAAELLGLKVPERTAAV